MTTPLTDSPAVTDEQLERLRNWVVPGGIYDGIRHDPRPDLRALLADYDALRKEVEMFRAMYDGRAHTQGPTK